MFVIVSYDISDDRRRQKVAKVLKDFGERVQFSVFEADVDQNQFKRLEQRIIECLDQDEDSVRIYPLCSSCISKVKILGQGILIQDPDFIIV